MKEEIKHEIRNFIVENFLFGEANGLSESDSLLEKGVIDSTGILELIAFIEEKYRIHVEQEELVPENLDSIVNVSDYIVRKQAPVEAVICQPSATI